MDSTKFTTGTSQSNPKLFEIPPRPWSRKAWNKALLPPLTVKPQTTKVEEKEKLAGLPL